MSTTHTNAVFPDLEAYMKMNDGRRYIIKLNPAKNYVTEIVREIPPRNS